MRTALQLRVPLVAALAVGLLTTMAVEAARLTEVSRQEVRLENGEPVDPAGPRRITAAATGSGSISHGSHFTSAPDITSPGSWSTDILDDQVLFEIQPEAGESIGDCVWVDFIFAATGNGVTVTGAADARVGLGGFGATGEAEPEVEVVLTFDGPTQITLNPGPGEVVQFASGPLVVAPGDPPIDLLEEGSFLARIGDEVQLNLTLASAWSVPGGDVATSSTDVSLDAEVREGVVACPAPSVTEIPTLDQWGFGGLALLLAAAGCLMLTRRQLA